MILTFYDGQVDFQCSMLFVQDRSDNEQRVLSSPGPFGSITVRDRNFDLSSMHGGVPEQTTKLGGVGKSGATSQPEVDLPNRSIIYLASKRPVDSRNSCRTVLVKRWDLGRSRGGNIMKLPNASGLIGSVRRQAIRGGRYSYEETRRNRRR